MKTQKIITIITVILLVAIICMASFIGIYKKQDYKIVNVVPNYTLGMDFENSRIVEFKVDDSVVTTIYDNEGNEITEKDSGIEYTEENGYTTVETRANSDEVLTAKNYQKTKSILKYRLNKLGIEQYIIRQLDDGNITLQILEDENTNDAIEYLSQKGTFELIDSETKEVLLNNKNIEKVSVVYSQPDATQTAVYLQVKFNKEGKEKLQEISKTYIETTTQATNEEGELEDKTETKSVTILLDGQTFRTTYFGETITDGNLNLAVGAGTNSDELKQYVDVAKNLAVILNGEVIPVEYTVESKIVSPTFEEQKIFTYIFAIVLVIIIVYSIIKLKTKGIMLSILQIGYIALLLLALRYTNIKIAIDGIIGILISMLLNYIYLYTGFNNINESFISITKKVSLKLIPAYIVAVIFTFNNILNISSLGMVLVWGIIVMYIYNLISTNITLKVLKD